MYLYPDDHQQNAPSTLARTIRASRWRRNAMLVATAVGVVGVIYALSSRHPSSALMPPMSAPSVAVDRVKKGDLPLEVQALGTVTPLSTVTLKSRISGYLTAVAFKEGQMVKKGDLLAQIDARPYEAALAQSQGQLIKDQALLRNAQLDLTRHERLLAQDSTSRQNFDTATSTVRQLEGVVKSDQAQVDAQRLDVAYCHIVAPTDGRAGLRQVDSGNYVQAADANGLVVITQVQPISVIFTIPQVQLGPVLKRLRANVALPVTAYDSNNTTLLGDGVLDTIDNQIDISTGTVKLRAVFATGTATSFRTSSSMRAFSSIRGTMCFSYRPPLCATVCPEPTSTAYVATTPLSSRSLRPALRTTGGPWCSPAWLWAIASSSMESIG
jgi:RND family efflux transporter MFP subunit